MYKTIYQKNKRNSISFIFNPKVSVKFPNLKFGAVRNQYCEQVKKDKIVVRSLTCSQLEITANNMLHKNRSNTCSQLPTANRLSFLTCSNSPKLQVWEFHAYFWNKFETYTILFVFLINCLIHFKFSLFCRLQLQSTEKHICFGF